ncbi:leucine zipper domain-containing protein [Hamadaea sp. NPDC050747]
MHHRNARLTLHGRRLLISHVVGQGRPVARTPLQKARRG